jgi:hypothetical protein
MPKAGLEQGSRRSPEGELRQVRSTGERAPRVAATACAIVIVCALAPARSAGAIGPTAFNMSSSSGPPGSVVSVSGSGCSPGPLLQSTSVTVRATTVPPTNVQLPVHANGSWSGSFTIPADALAAPAAVTAECVSGGLLSLLTIYTPKTFTVTGSLVPTTPPSPLPTLPGTTTRADPGNPSDPGSPNPGTSSPVSVPNDRVDHGTPGSGDGTGGSDGTSGSARSGNGADEGGAGSGAIGATSSGEHGPEFGSGTRAAELNSPELSVSRSGDGAGLGWLLWVLALSLPVGGVAFYLWMRRARGPSVPDPEAHSA